MAVKIEKKIVGYSVQKPEDKAAKLEPASNEPKPIVMNESVERPDFLLGSTYKIKPSVSEHAFYITINDIILNEGTDHEARRPYEIFINSKSMEHFQWVIALTRVISAVFRKGGDITFLLEELLSVHDPSGGYYKKGGVFMPSLVADIGSVIEKHMKMLGIIESENLSDNQKCALAEKRAEYDARQSTSPSDSTAEDNSFPANATMCKKCSHKSVILMDGCQTCLNCGDSKCS